MFLKSSCESSAKNVVFKKKEGGLRLTKKKRKEKYSVTDL